jgi:hypothetical protein
MPNIFHFLHNEITLHEIALHNNHHDQISTNFFGGIPGMPLPRAGGGLLASATSGKMMGSMVPHVKAPPPVNSAGPVETSKFFKKKSLKIFFAFFLKRNLNIFSSNFNENTSVIYCKKSHDQNDLFYFFIFIIFFIFLFYFFILFF